MLTAEVSLKGSMLITLKDVFPSEPLLFPEGQSSRALRDAAINASLENCYGNMIADSHIYYIDGSLFLSVPLMHMDTALQSLVGLREIMKRIGVSLTDVYVKLDSIESHYQSIK